MVHELDADGHVSSLYMVFSFMEHDLTGLIERKDVRFSLPQVKCYLSQILTGIKYLHERGVLHRDVKGANVLINNRGELKLTDFGLSRPLEPGRTVYTPGVYTRWYRPPELLLGSREYGTSADMWGIGCILAEMLTKRPTFPGEGDFEQLELISRVCGTPSSQTMPRYKDYDIADKVHLPVYRRKLREIFGNLDPLAVDLIDKLMVLDPEKRYSAEQAMQHDFFTSPPLPALPQSLPTYTSSHELTHAPHPTPHQHGILDGGSLPRSAHESQHKIAHDSHATHRERSRSPRRRADLPDTYEPRRKRSISSHRGDATNHYDKGRYKHSSSRLHYSTREDTRHRQDRDARFREHSQEYDRRDNHSLQYPPRRRSEHHRRDHMDYGDL
jgi:serine/threonine protein kinase